MQETGMSLTLKNTPLALMKLKLDLCFKSCSEFYIFEGFFLDIC